MSQSKYFLYQNQQFAGPSPWVSNDEWIVSKQLVEMFNKNEVNSFQDRAKLKNIRKMFLKYQKKVRKELLKLVDIQKKFWNL